MKNEAELWRYLVGPALNQSGMAERFENAAGTGMSDVSYAIRGRTGFIELKMVHGSQEYPTLTLQRTQIPWLTERTKHSPDYWIIGFQETTDTIFFIHAARLLRMPITPTGDRHNKVELVWGLVDRIYSRSTIDWPWFIERLSDDGFIFSAN